MKQTIIGVSMIGVTPDGTEVPLSFSSVLGPETPAVQQFDVPPGCPEGWKPTKLLIMFKRQKMPQA